MFQTPHLHDRACGAIWAWPFFFSYPSLSPPQENAQVSTPKKNFPKLPLFSCASFKMPRRIINVFHLGLSDLLPTGGAGQEGRKRGGGGKAANFFHLSIKKKPPSPNPDEHQS